MHSLPFGLRLSVKLRSAARRLSVQLAYALIVGLVAAR